jgi:hypothetical protein
MPEQSLVDGLRFVYAPLSLTHAPIEQLTQTSDSATVVKAVTETEETYARAAKRLGLPEHLPEARVNEWGYGQPVAAETQKKLDALDHGAVQAGKAKP